MNSVKILFEQLNDSYKYCWDEMFTDYQIVDTDTGQYFVFYYTNERGRIGIMRRDFSEIDLFLQYESPENVPYKLIKEYAQQFENTDWIEWN